MPGFLYVFYCILRVMDVTLFVAFYRCCFHCNVFLCLFVSCSCRIFSKHFEKEVAAQTVPGGPSIACSTPAAIEWDAAFKNAADPSGRAVAGVHVDAY
jgi:hypothetical protein